MDFRSRFPLPWGSLGGYLVSGILLRPLHTFSKLWCTDSYVLTVSGIWCLAFLLLYRQVDADGRFGWMKVFVPVGQNPLLLYLLPDLLNNLLSLLGIRNWVFPLCRQSLWLGSLNILVVTAVLCMITAYATRKRFILKL